MISDAVKYSSIGSTTPITAITSDYTYDDNGNITNKLCAIYNDDNEYGTIDIMNLYDSEDRISKSGYNDYFFCYQYDSDGQLIRADHEYFDNFTSTYVYDSRGNVTAKSIYACTHDETITSSPIATVTFTYANSGWKDLLVSVNGVELTYDEIGNVLTYGNRSFTWNSGRNLQKIVDGDNEYSYIYDENGIRTSKTVNGVTTYYNTKDGVILSQSDGTNTLYFQYDTSGTPFGFIYNGTQYFYLTNQMGDVIAVIDINGYVIGEYVYDEWGNQSVHVTDDEDEYAAVTNANPLRYRGYYYDVETGYYYLQSRYYDPSICRFINADVPEIAKVSKDISVGTNLFAYCNNDPINSIDIFGFISISTANISVNEKRFTINLTDSDIRKIKLGLPIFALIYKAISTSIGRAFAIPTEGISIIATKVASKVVDVVCGFTAAYINYKDHGKGAKIEIYVKHGINTFYFMTWRYTRWRIRTVYWVKYQVPYAYVSRIPKITWYR